MKLFFHYNDNIKAVYNDLDTNIVSLNSENADIFAQLLFHQGNFETFLFRNYYNIISDNIGIDLLHTLNIEENVINSNFVFSSNEEDIPEKCEKCYFVFGEELIKNENLFLKKLYVLIPIIEISLDTFAFTKDNLKIFNKFHFYDNNTNSYISYKYDKVDIENNFISEYQPIIFMNHIISYIKYRAPLIEELNDIKINDLSYKDFFDNNILTLFIPKGNSLFIDPFYKSDQQTIHFASLFLDEQIDHNEKIDNLNFLKFQDIENYISFDIKMNYLSYLLLNFMKTNGNFVFVLVNDLSFSASKSICRLNDYNNYTYSDDSINVNLNLTVDYLDINSFQSENISECFINSDIQKIIQSDIQYNYKLKLLYDMFKYNDERDINSKIKIKILRELSPNKYTTSFLNLQFYYSFSYHFLIFKIYNNIIIFTNIIDRIIFKQVSYIILFIFILWVCSFIYIFIKLFLISDRISSPIKKLIKNISLSQSKFSADNFKLEQIYYKEDKDINDLFQLCQNLIIGGFKNKINIQKKNKLNIYNNISKVKTNNMVINENKIIIQRNQKYNEIFEKGEDKQNSNDSFKQDIYYKYKNKDFDNKIKKYGSKKLKKLFVEEKEEFNKIKNKDNEFKMFYYINKEIEDTMPYNNLYQFYYEKFENKSSKRKKK